MEIPPEVIAAKDALEDALLEAGIITGIDFGVRNEEQPDPEDLVLRIFIADVNKGSDQRARSASAPRPP